MSFTDGKITRGGYTIDLDTAGLTAIVDTSTLNRNSKVIQRTNENDEPAAQYVYPDWDTLTATIQVNENADRADLRGDTFTTAAFGDPLKFVVVSQGSPNTKGQALTYDLTCNRVYNVA